MAMEPFPMQAHRDMLEIFHSDCSRSVKVTLQKATNRTFDGEYGAEINRDVTEKIITCYIEPISKDEMELLGPGFLTISDINLYSKPEDDVRIHDRINFREVWYEIIQKKQAGYYGEVPVIDEFFCKRESSSAKEAKETGGYTG